VTHLRATLTTPLRVVDADRGPDGFDLALEVPADGRGSVVVLQGFDAGGTVVAVGSSPPIPLAAVDADMAVYMAAPMSLAAAPVALDPPRTAIGTTLLPYGVMLAGGNTATGPTTDLAIYNAYTHAFDAGKDLPAERQGLAVGYSPSGYAYLFGGADTTGTASGITWRFDTQAQPDGIYVQLDDDPALARVGATAAPLGFEQFLITGAPPALLNGLTGVTDASVLGAELPPVAVSVQDGSIADSPVYTVIVGGSAGTTGVQVYTDGGIADVQATEALRTGHGGVPTPDTQVVVIGGETVADGLLASALRIDPFRRTVSVIPDALVTPRRDAAIATNGEVLVVAGGIDATGAILPDAEIIDLASLTPIMSIAMAVPRTGAIARPLPTGQVMIVGGVDAAGNAVGTIELFTPLITPPT
jgi:hypothetical protein